MKLMALIGVGATVVWALATVLCACKLASDADDLARTLRQRKRRRNADELGKWLRFHGGLK